MEDSQIPADDLTSILTRLGDKIDRASDNTVNIVKAEISEVKSKLTSLDAKIAQLGSRLDNIEQEQLRVNSRLLRIEKDSSETKKSLSTTKTQLQNELKEEIAQLKCASNLIMYNVPESPEGVKIAMNLLAIILPERVGSFPMIRINQQEAQVNHSSQTRPRLLKIILNNVAERNIALKNCKLLKGKDEFKGISVKPDQTKLQRSARSPYPLRSRKRARTEAEDQTQEEESGKKMPKSAQSVPESDIMDEVDDSQQD